MSRKTKKPIFVVGCSRSGTTVLQACLAASDQVFAFPETQLPFTFFSDSESLMFNSEAHKKNLITFFKAEAFKISEKLGFCRRNFPWLINNSQRDHLNTLPTGIPRTFLMRRAFEEYRTAVEAVTNKEFWSEKSPRNIFVVDQIERYIPDALFLHIIRPGEDTIASLIDAGRKHSAFASRFGGERGVERACDYWNKATSITKRHANLDHHHVTLYDDLIENPEREIRRVCRFLGLEYSEEMARPNFDAVREKRETWKFSYGDTLSRAIPKYEQLTLAEKKTIAQSIVFSRDDISNIFRLNEAPSSNVSTEA